MADNPKSGGDGGPMDRLKTEARGLLGALGERAMTSVRDRVGETTSRLTDYVEGGGGPGLMAAVTGAKGMAEGKGPARSMLGAGMKGISEKVKGLFGKGGKGGGQGKKLKITNIVESIDVGVPIDVAYNQWTQFRDFSGFMKKVENVDQVEDEKLHWKAQILWSHREWDADIIDQIPNERIIWRSKGQKGHVDGAVTFHEITPTMTRILVVLEYHPQGMFERTGNLWRAQGRRARLELKHFRRHVMTTSILHPDEIEGWRGRIEDGEVVQDHEAALQEEERGESEDREPEDRADGEERDDDEREDDEREDDDQPEDVGDEEDLGDEDADDEDEEDEPSPNGRGPSRRTAQAAEGSRAQRRGRRPSGRSQEGRRGVRAEDRPRPAVRRRAATRGGE